MGSRKVRLLQMAAVAGVALGAPFMPSAATAVAKLLLSALGMASAVPQSATASSGTKDSEELSGLFSALGGVAGNLWASDIDRRRQAVLERFDLFGENGLPRDSDFERASADALRNALLCLTIAAAGKVEREAVDRSSIAQFLHQVKPGRWLPQRHSASGEHQWLRDFEDVLRSPEALENWHRTLDLDSKVLDHCFEGDAELTDALADALMEWIGRHLGLPTPPDDFMRMLREGWPAGPQLGHSIRLGQAYTMFMVEHIKSSQRISSQLSALTLKGIDADQQKLAVLVAEANHSLSGLTASQQDLVDRVAQADARLARLTGQCQQVLDTMLEQLPALRAELQAQHAVHMDAVVALFALGTQSMQDVRFDLAALRLEFANARGEIVGMLRQASGVTLVRPGAKASTDERWVAEAKYRALQMVGRERELALLWQWVHDDQAVAIRLVSGRAGSGKSRLAYELIWHLEEVYGMQWNVGIADPDEVGAGKLRGWVRNRPTLVVIDEARTLTGALHELIKDLLKTVESEPGPKLRILLLERPDASLGNSSTSNSSTSSWLRDLHKLRHQHAGPVAEALFSPEVKLPDMSLEARRAIFVGTLHRLGRQDLAAAVPELEELPVFDAMLKDWRDPFVPIMSAFASKQGGNLLAGDRLAAVGLATEMVQRERERLLVHATTYLKGDLADSDKRLVERMAAAVLLCLPSRPVRFMVDHEPNRPAESPALSLREIIDIAADQLAETGRPHWPKGPGGLAELFVEAWGDREATCWGLRSALLEEAVILDVLGKLERTSASVPMLRRLLNQHSGKHTEAVCARVLHSFRDYHSFRDNEQALRFAPALRRWVDELVGLAKGSADPELARALDVAMPWNTPALHGDAFGVARLMHEAALKRCRDDPCDEAKLNLGRAVRNLSERKARLGPSEEAVGWASESVAIFRSLCERDTILSDADRAHHERELALSLHVLAARHANLFRGRADEAHLAAKEAVARLKALCQPMSNAFASEDRHLLLRQLGSALSNLSMRECWVGHFGEARQHADEACKIIEDLLRSFPTDEQLQNELRSALNARLEAGQASGDSSETLAEVERLVARLEPMARLHRDAFEPALASALDRLCGLHIDQVPRKSVQVARRAIRLHDRLLKRNREEHLPGLASIYKKLATAFGRRKRWAAACGCAARAVQLCEEIQAMYRENNTADGPSPRPDQGDWQPAVADAGNRLAGLLLASGKTLQAQKPARRAARLAYELSRDKPELAELLRDCLHTLYRVLHARRLDSRAATIARCVAGSAASRDGRALA